MTDAAPPRLRSVFSTNRPRRTRRTETLRQLVRETIISPADLILPLFVRPGHDLRMPIRSMPGQFQWSVDRLVGEVRRVAALGIRGHAVRHPIAKKTPAAARISILNGIVPQAIRAIKQAVPEMVVISDMCFCEYTDHGHCGVINLPGSEHFNPALREAICSTTRRWSCSQRASIVHAAAGADIIAPSGMIDGMVGAIRSALDGSGHEHVW